MSSSQIEGTAKPYYVGIDVGTHSVGMVAIEVDQSGFPLAILNAVCQLHDSGVLDHKTATTRLAAAGVARRVRRLRRRKAKRLAALERRFLAWGWGGPPDSTDPYAPWRARARLATERVGDETERHALLVTAIRHIARHRGWRNPYTRVAALYEEREPSEFFRAFQDRVESRTGRAQHPAATVAEVAVAALDFDPNVPLRMGKTEKRHVEREFSYLGGKLHQSDLANEIHVYARVQGLPEELVRQIVDAVFVAESPRGSTLRRVGKDPFDGSPRAAKATDAFQRYRIASVLANVRVSDGTESRRLSVVERQAAFSALATARPGDAPTWSQVGVALGLGRGALRGVASLDADGAERLPLRPPVHETDRAVMAAPRKTLGMVSDWWREATTADRDALIQLMTDGEVDERTSGGVSAWELLNLLDETALVALDGLALPAGRAAYSVRSLHALTEEIVTSTGDLHDARKAVFGIDDGWVPPAEPINAPVGNPAVDRVTKIVGRWLAAAEAEWGAPLKITIEHVREAFASENVVREREREMRRRFEQNDLARKALSTSGGRVTHEDIRRHDAITRQKGQCAYCGETITAVTSEMDHIVPRKGVGSTNTRSNLVAVCIECNRLKGNSPFSTWAEAAQRPGVSVRAAVERTRFWTRDRGLSQRTWAAFLRQVRDRMERAESDPAIDGRSMESVAWMANELHDRIASTPAFREAGTKVSVYQGAVTAGARGAAGIEGRIPLIGGSGKTRLDRRHHAVDAAVVALLDESVARTLAERNNLRVSGRISRHHAVDWREHEGSGPEARRRFAEWKLRMDRLADLLAVALSEDCVVVTENLRLRFGSGKVHEDTVNSFVRVMVGSEMSRERIDAASTPALWTALTRDPDFDPESGLPDNPSRTLRVRGSQLTASDSVEFFDKPRAAVAVRGGWSELGDSIHHARIYRWEEQGRLRHGMLRVFTADLLRNRHADLFSADPLPSWVSIRSAHPKIGRASLQDLEYLGWLVPGDELLLSPDDFRTGHLATFQEVFGSQVRWRVAGFDSPTRLKLKPILLAAEGLDAAVSADGRLRDAAASLKYVLDRGWLVSVNELWTRAQPTVVRRDALGRPRLESRAGLPTSWSAG